MRETELKLELAAQDDSAVARHPLLAGAPVRTRRERSNYFDSAKGALRHAGFSLRVREAEGRFMQTAKLQEGAAGLFDRPEWEVAVASAEPDPAALAETPLAPLIAGKKLVRQFVSEVERSAWRIEADGARFEIVLDRGCIRAGKHETPLGEVEIELLEGKPASLFAVASQLAEAASLRIGVMTKAERGQALALGQLDKVAKAEKLALSADKDVAGGFAAIVTACLRHFRLNEPLILRTRDPLALHQARVAMRRLRSAFSLFGAAVQDDRFAAIREELRWFTGELGDARNLDVMLKALPRGKARGLRKHLQAARTEAYDRVEVSLESARLRALLLELLAWASTGEWRAQAAAQQPLMIFARDRLDRRWRKIKKAGRHVAVMEDEPRHRLRIDIKKMRYAIEFTAGLFPDDAAREGFLAGLAAMQESLGELNDQATGEAMIATLPKKLQSAARRYIAPGDDRRDDAPQIVDAQNGYRQLREIGPFWRDRGAA